MNLLECANCNARLFSSSDPGGRFWIACGEAGCPGRTEPQADATTKVDLNLSINSPEILALIERVVGEEQEKCCGDVCAFCAAGDEVTRVAIQTNLGEASKWSHPIRIYGSPERWADCQAAQIRERAWQQAREASDEK